MYTHIPRNHPRRTQVKLPKRLDLAQDPVCTHNALLGMIMAERAEVRGTIRAQALHAVQCYRQPNCHFLDDEDEL